MNNPSSLYSSLPSVPRRIAVATLVLFLSAPAFAGRYELVKGKGVEVCEAYKKNLESFNDPYPMVCARRVNPAFKDFEKPMWQDLDVRGKDRELLRRALRYQGGDRDQFLGSVYQDNELNTVIGDREERSWIKEPLLSRTQVDIDNDGQIENILVLRDGACPDTSFSTFSTNLFVLKKGSRPQETMIATDYPAEKLLRQRVSPNLGSRTIADIFRYKGESYVDKYCAFKNPHSGCDDIDVLTVFKIEKNVVNEICRYKHQIERH